MLNTQYPLLIQVPYGTQNPDANKPIDLTSPFDLIVFIILPILVVVFYIFWRRNKRRDREEDGK